MANTQIRNTQIFNNEITDVKINSAAAIASTKLAAWGADRDANNNKLTNLGTPTVPGDGANKAYVDALASGLNWKDTCRAVATTNVGTMSGPQTVDGVSLVAGERVLLTAQTTGGQNGIWEVKAGSWTRPADVDSGAKLVSAAVFIEEGSAPYADTGWVATANAPITIDVTDPVFVQFTIFALTAGNGIDKPGNTISVKRDATGGANLSRSIDVNTNGVAVRIDDTTIEEESGSGFQRLAVKNSGISWGKLAGAVQTRLGRYDRREDWVAAGGETFLDLAVSDADQTDGGILVYVNGLLHAEGVSLDYQLSDNGGVAGVDRITFNFTLVLNDLVTILYKRDGAAI